ncbi:MAG: hypothetical protein GXP24_11235 [Planctomycetes bacterium]|nr:hypothetical protein [Planctomycetota bacterium]
MSPLLICVLLRPVCLSVLLLLFFSSTALAQAAPEVVPESSTTQPAETASAEVAKTETAKTETTPSETTPPPAPEPFQLPAEQHLWARFQPGAWRDLQTVTETFDETGQVVSRNVTTRKEVLQAVAEGKYVLKIQATVDLSGKRIVGDWKNHTLHLATDGAGTITDSHRLEDQTLSLAGRTVECQVFELHYREGSRKLTDRIHYAPQRFPFVLHRETFPELVPAEGSPKEAATDATAEAEQLIEVMAQTVPHQVGEQLLACSLLRAFRHRPKGDTLRLAYLNRTVPGGEVAVWTTDFDAQGQLVRWSVTTLLAYGETPPDDAESSTDSP